MNHGAPAARAFPRRGPGGPLHPGGKPLPHEPVRAVSVDPFAGKGTGFSPFRAHHPQGGADRGRPGPAGGGPAHPGGRRLRPRIGAGGPRAAPRLAAGRRPPDPPPPPSPRPLPPPPPPSPPPLPPLPPP